MKYLLETLKMGTRNYIERTWPGSDVKIRIRPITACDTLESTIETDRLFKSRGVDITLQNVREYEAEKDLQRLYRACTDVDGNPLAPGIFEFRKNLTISEKAWLIDMYAELEEELNPSIETMPDADFDALVADVKKNPDMVLSSLSIGTLKRLVRFLASPPVTLPTVNGSTSQ